MSVTQLFNTEQGKLAFRTYGDGAKILLLFHGFGQDGSIFESLCKSLSKEYTAYSFDLYFHGNSVWNDGGLPLSKSAWHDTITSFLSAKKIESFSLLAFSLGGKFALTTIETFASRLNEVILLAPDGIGTSFWYNLATYPILFQKYFKSIIDRPQRLFRIIRWLQKTSLMDKGLLKFAGTQMNTVENRSRVYHSWIIFKRIKPDLAIVSRLLSEEGISLQIYLGEHDKVITHRSLSPFLNQLPGHKISILPCGHNQLIQNVTDIFSQNP